MPATRMADCGAGVQLFLSKPTAGQGDLLLADLSSETPLTGIRAMWVGEEIPVWPAQVNPAMRTRSLHWHAFIAVDLETKTGAYPLTVIAQDFSGAKISCQLAVPVIAGKFATESLRVAPQFVEPNPEQLERAKTEQQRLREIYATVTPEKLWQGKFRVPLNGVTSGANFGRRRVLNGEPSSPHTGVDFPAPIGTPVHAAQAGRVVLAEPLFFAGNTVVIDHGLGVYTLYGHLSQIAVTVGDNVTVGAVLGKVGATGRVTGPHLHWGLTINHSRVNALQIVKFPAN